MSSADLSATAARQLALAAQGIDRPQGRVYVRHLRRVIHQLGLLQIDYVNVLLARKSRISFLMRFAKNRAQSASGCTSKFHAGGQWIITSHVRAIAVEASATGAPC